MDLTLTKLHNTRKKPDFSLKACSIKPEKEPKIMKYLIDQQLRNWKTHLISMKLI